MAMLERTTNPDKKTVGSIGDIWSNVVTGMKYKLVSIIMGTDNRVWYDWQLIDDNDNPGGGGGVSVTSESIKGALGYTPANQNDVNKLQGAKVVVSNDEPEDGSLWIDEDNDEEVILAEINDDEISDEKTWSSSKIDEKLKDPSNKVSLPTSGDAADYGTMGQFAVSDGKGGIMWKTIHQAEEVSY